jgi:hypothetical protein
MLKFLDNIKGNPELIQMKIEMENYKNKAEEKLKTIKQNVFEIKEETDKKLLALQEQVNLIREDAINFYAPFTEKLMVKYKDRLPFGPSDDWQLEFKDDYLFIKEKTND